MRLSYLKLSGFKSFVDPTTLHFPGALVGIVGPNGCGKSNVIDAVRWVLGESKASELRGESMQDVIFSGAGTRKPSGRASVELVFENNEGRITGPWAQYSEIAVKRILTRDNQSTYWINNQAVRRKDVYDLFMGTGLGPRAYAIIGQGMISRVIESRPEELRVFLEEAAGVSKYRERRKETEGRLSDARENLARVEDIRLELENQIARLEQQAELAQRYSEIVARRDERQQWLWWTRREEFVQGIEKSKARRSASELDMEAKTSTLRSLERQIEEARASYHQASDDVHEAQARLFETNTEITKIEAEQRRLSENRDRAMVAKEHALDVIETESSALAQGDAKRVADADAAVKAEGLIVQKREALTQIQSALAPLEQALASRNESLSAAQADAAATQAELRGLSDRLNDISQRARRIESRIAELEKERQSIEKTDPSATKTLSADKTQAAQRVRQIQLALSKAESEFEQATAQCEQLRSQLSLSREAQAQAQAQHDALQGLQAQADGRDRLLPWLGKKGMDKPLRLIDRIKVNKGWQTAVEAVLSERMGAIEISGLAKAADWAKDAPPARVTLFSAELGSGENPPAGSLAAQVSGEGHASAALRGWLAHVFCAESLSQAISKSGSAKHIHECWVTAEGHIASRGAVRLYASEDVAFGMLERKQKIQTLREELSDLQKTTTAHENSLAKAEQSLSSLKEAVAQHREALAQAQSAAHLSELTELRHQEKLQRLASQEETLSSTLETLRKEFSDLQRESTQVEELIESAESRLAEQTQEVNEQRGALETQQSQVESARGDLQQADRAVGEALLAQRLAAEQTKMFEENLRQSVVRLAEAKNRLAGAEQEIIDAQTALDTSLIQPLLDQRVDREHTVAQIREHADQLNQSLRALDEQRITCERELEPLRTAIAQIDAELSGARVGIDQIEEQMSDAQVTSADIADSLAKAHPDGKYPRPSTLHAEVQRLTKEIESVGPVNLAALSELEGSRERKTFLDSQHADLMSAVQTLEDAIRKIDLETRSLLQDTFDTVNQNFNTLFPRLFGGGEARLVMTGEEILDCGVQVMAQPPGKRNTSIHLLSGGEKALTAIALVFALFQLNPAPFCLLDEVDAPLDDPNTERFCNLVRHMSSSTQFIFITHNKIAMEMAQHLMGVTMQEQGVSRVVAVDLDAANTIVTEAA